MPVSICQGGTVTLNGSGAQSYVWNNGVTNGTSFTPTSTTTYTVTGTAANGCQGTDQVTVTVNPLPNVNAGNDEAICIGSEITLSGSGAVSYSWNNGVSNGVPFTTQNTQTYVVTGTDGNGCVNTDQITITVVPIPVAEITSDVDSGFPTLTVNFDNNSINGTTYQWNFGNGVQLNASNTVGQQMDYSAPGSYVVYLVAQNGSCVDSDTLLITVNPFPDPIVIIPNIFTSNGDNSNDEFFLNVSNVKSVSVQIVNRWGARMIAYDDVQGYWDGTVNGNPASEGVYFFTYVVEGINGTVLSGQGSVELIR